MSNRLMELFGNSKWLEQLVDKQLEVIKELSRCCCKEKANPVHLVLISTKNGKFIIMNLEITSAQHAVGTLGLIDSVTNAIVTATFTATTAVSDNPAIATAAVNADGTITITGVAAGVANILVNSTASFTNSLGVATTGVVTESVAVTIDAVTTADGVTLQISFAPPVAN